MTIQQLIKLKESEDKIEFKEAKTQYNYNNGRKSVLGYVCALANEGGGILAFGIKETKPYTLVNSQAYTGRIGQLEQNIYRDKGIRVKVSELFDEDNNRVVIIEIPSRPIGKMLYYEDVALMRVGDRLERMNEEMYASIVMEKEPDFSAKICPELTLGDIDEHAVAILKEKYALKQKNPEFRELPTEQVLKDLGLMTNEGITYAALILLGKEEALAVYLPNAQINIEYRKTPEQTHFDKRYVYLKPLFLEIDDIWSQLNARNLDHKIDQNPYKFDIAYFNEEVIREAVLNAIAHRDYTINSEVVIKQTPEQITITNAGGFPKGVNLDNLLTINSTPRSRLLTEILERTGLVERSGQGVDKIFRITLSEGKPLPDYSKSDLFQVELKLNAAMEDSAFAMFMYQVQADRAEDNPIGTFKTMALHSIKEGKSEGIDVQLLQELEQEELIKRSGGSASEKYVLADRYFDIKDTPSEIGGFRIIDLERVLNVLKDNPVAKMKDFVAAFDSDLNREQVRYLIDKLVNVVLDKQGSGSGTTYSLKGGVIDLNNITDILKGA